MAEKPKPTHWIVVLSGLAILLALTGSMLVSAQTTPDSWTTPVNLSHSGSTNNPVAVQDAAGIIHVIWQDKYADYVYSRLDGGEWSQPLSEPFPFGDTSPRLLADSKGFIHAFWIDNDGSLAYAHLTPKPTGLNFDKTQFIAEAALSFDATIDARDNLHVVYVRPKEAAGVPAGIYYRESLDGGISWAPGDVLYPSPYFRGIDKKDANVSIASAEVSGQERLYVAWDNKPRKQVLFSMSSDDGKSWSDPAEIQGAEPSLDYASPYGIKVGAFGTNVLLIWQTGDPSATCRQSYQWSSDGGLKWENPRTMLADFFSCPQGNTLLSDNKGLIFLLTTLRDQLYLSAWDGSQWSQPEFQRTLTGFMDAETHDMVLFACQAPVLLKNGQMFVVGCDQGDGGDIWATRRPVSDTKTWFPPPPVWSQPTEVGNAKSDMMSLVSTYDSQGNFHVMWTQMQDPSVVSSGAQPKRVIYYSQNDGKGWTQPANVLVSPGGDADQLSIAIDGKDRLLAAWREKQSGEIYFSWASASQASGPSEWTSPQALPVVQALATSPSIQVDSSGTIYVAYAIPINENRGIYLTASSDEGATWSKSTRAVDAVAAQWEMVDAPQLSTTRNGYLHLVWNPEAIVGVAGPLGLYYAHSEDGGLTWSQPVSMEDGPVYWSSLVVSGDTTVNVVWQEQTLKGFVMKHRVSLDGGQTWERAAVIASFGASPVPASITVEGGGQVNLVVVDQDTAKDLVLKQWSWNGQLWSEEDGRDLNSDPSIGIPSLSSAVSQTSLLGVAYNLAVGGGNAGSSSNTLEFTDRKLVASKPGTPQATTATPAVISTSTSVSTPTVTPTVEATPTPTTIALAVTPSPQEPTRSRREIYLGIGMVVIVAAVVGLIIARMLIRRGATGVQ